MIRALSSGLATTPPDVDVGAGLGGVRHGRHRGLQQPVLGPALRAIAQVRDYLRRLRAAGARRARTRPRRRASRRAGSYADRSFQGVAQPAQSGTDSGLYRSQRQPDSARDLLVRDAAEKAELDRLALFGAAAAPARRARERRPGWQSRRPRAYRPAAATRGTRPSSRTLRQRTTSSARLRVTRAIQAPKFPPRKSAGLSQIFRNTACVTSSAALGIGKHAQRQPVDEAMIPVVERLEGSGVTGAHALHEPARVFHRRQPSLQSSVRTSPLNAAARRLD